MFGLMIGGTARAGGASGCTTTVAKRPALTASLGPGSVDSEADFVLNAVVLAAVCNAPDVTPIRGASTAR